jgi:asparagine synthase (glutamine-hydrolysing)
MCGIAGIVEPEGGRLPSERQMRQMLSLIRHRGPDQFGVYTDDRVALGNARLSIVDLSHGQQPIANEDGSLWIVYNGEVFNHVELRPELEALGHRFATDTDTEVVLHLYEEYGPAALERLNGQFAIAIWDASEETLFLARDRLGVRPIFYTQAGGAFLFGSEIKVLLADDRVEAKIDVASLDQVFTFWSTLSPRTIFEGISELPPGHYLLLRRGRLSVHRYWEIDFQNGPSRSPRALGDLVEEFRHLLIDATQIRLRADVPVGAYLSGGLDSSTIASIIRKCTSNRLDTFSITFDDADFDESAFQLQMARHVGTEHQVVHASHDDIGREFPNVVWHTEVPIMRTSPVPMFLLSKLVRDRKYKVVLTGEGADEFLGGYDIFKEAKVRRFWAESPGSTWRPLLFRRLYRDIPGMATGSSAFLAAFFKDRLTEVDAPCYSHYIRWRNNRRTRRFFSENVTSRPVGDSNDFLEQVAVPPKFHRWGAMERAQFLEINIFLSEYLLSSQGDRVAMAHSVEGRYPFLDFRVVEFCARLPSNLKLRGLNEKFLLKKVAQAWLPEGILQRPKRPYRAPIHRSFFGRSSADYVRELLSPAAVRESGLFNPAAVSKLAQKIEGGAPVGETDDMALAGILSSQLVYRQFVRDFKAPPPLDERDDVKVCSRPALTRGS